MKLFPAIDIQEGRAVRLRRGDFADATVFADDPVEQAREWERQEADALHVVDLDGARRGTLVNFEVVRAIVDAVGIPVEYGGGVRSSEALQTVAASGVEWVVLGTAAVTDLDLLDEALRVLGPRLVVGVDCESGIVATHGWQQRSEMSALHFVHLLKDRGVRRIVYTDVLRDGMLEGPNLEGLHELTEGTAARDRHVGRHQPPRRPALGQARGARRGGRHRRSRPVREVVHAGRRPGRVRPLTSVAGSAEGRREAPLLLQPVVPCTKRIIPCLDVRAGRVVKGVNFVDIRDAGDPVELAARYWTPRAPTSSSSSTSRHRTSAATSSSTLRRAAPSRCSSRSIGGGLSSVDDVRAEGWPPGARAPRSSTAAVFIVTLSGRRPGLRARRRRSRDHRRW